MDRRTGFYEGRRGRRGLDRYRLDELKVRVYKRRRGNGATNRRHAMRDNGGTRLPGGVKAGLLTLKNTCFVSLIVSGL